MTARRPYQGLITRRTVLKGAALGAGGVLLKRAGLTTYAATTGPSTKVEPYVLPSMAGVEVKALLTTGDTVGSYRMSGIPDGLGAMAAGDNFKLFMNHELTTKTGVTRGHGSGAAFVSQWTIDRNTLQVVSGGDLTTSPNDVYLWDTSMKKYVQGTTEWQRLCSADLPEARALGYGSLGATERIFLDGEEVNEGRAWARIASGPNAGQAWQLPRLGRMAFENVVACPHSKDKTVVMMMDDGSINPYDKPENNPSEVYVYVGAKQTEGSPIERAGLTNGKLYGLRVYRGDSVITGEDDLYGFGNVNARFVGSARFELAQVGPGGDVTNMSGLQLEEDSISKDVFRFQRAEDGAWDPRASKAGDFYFVTTASLTNNSRLWRLHFNDLSKPEAGGTIEIVLNAAAGRMFDNITIDRFGRLLLQEDTGNAPHVSKVWVYGIDTDQFIEVAHHNEQLFQPGIAPDKFITQDEESSGIIDARNVLGDGWFLMDVQVHKTTSDQELVEGGQLAALYLPLDVARRV